MIWTSNVTSKGHTNKGGMQVTKEADCRPKTGLENEFSKASDEVPCKKYQKQQDQIHHCLWVMIYLSCLQLPSKIKLKLQCCICLLLSASTVGDVKQEDITTEQDDANMCDPCFSKPTCNEIKCQQKKQLGNIQRGIHGRKLQHMGKSQETKHGKSQQTIHVIIDQHVSVKDRRQHVVVQKNTHSNTSTNAVSEYNNFDETCEEDSTQVVTESDEIEDPDANVKKQVNSQTFLSTRVQTFSQGIFDNKAVIKGFDDVLSLKDDTKVRTMYRTSAEQAAEPCVDYKRQVANGKMVENRSDAEVRGCNEETLNATRDNKRADVKYSLPVVLEETRVMKKKVKLGRDVPEGRVLKPGSDGGKKENNDYVETLRELTHLPVGDQTVKPITVNMITQSLPDQVPMASTNRNLDTDGSLGTAQTYSLPVSDTPYSGTPQMPGTAVPHDANTASVQVTVTTASTNHHLDMDGHSRSNRELMLALSSQISSPETDTFSSGTPTEQDRGLNNVLQQIARGVQPGPKETMKYELLRLSTMRNYPRVDKPYIIRLAGAGFYYAADGDEVVCYCCGIRKRDWTADCNPLEIHRRLSPRCPFLTRNSQVNISVPQDTSSEGRDRFANLRELLAETPNTQAGSDSDLSAIEISRPQETPETRTNSPAIAGYSMVPKHPHYGVLGVRQSSFVGWPSSACQSPDILAEAGFYFAGIGDCVRCFHCGLGLRHWAVEDDPWVEHGRWTLDTPCYYLIQKKGEEFLSMIRMAIDVTNNQPPQVSADSTPQASVGEQSSTVQTPGNQSSATQSVSATGNHSDRLATRGAKGGNSSSGEMSGKNSLKQTRDTAKAATGNSGKKGPPSLEQKQLKEENRRLRQQTVCRVCEERDICIVFLPCGHLVTCAECAPSLRVCPVCNKGVKGTVKTYMG